MLEKDVFLTVYLNGKSWDGCVTVLLFLKIRWTESIPM